MDPCSVDHFFSIEHFAHRSLWDGAIYVWSPLIKLKNYITVLRHRIDIPIPPGVILKDPDLISIGEETVIEPGSYIEGPCIIGKGCTIRTGAYLRSFTLLGDRCVVGHGTEIKHSVIMDQATATHFAYVGDSIIGNKVNLAAGVKCANVRLDKEEVAVKLESVKIATGLRKFGAVVGDRSQIGCNCVLNPGTLIGSDVFASPLLNLGGSIPSLSRIRPRPSYEIERLTDPRAILGKMGKRS